MEIKRALISVSNKKGIADFAKGLTSLGIEIISTGGTAKELCKAGVEVTDVSKITGFPEMLDGRVKTLHPSIHAGILSRRKNKKDMECLRRYDIKTIDMVVCNLYPFEETIRKNKVTLDEILENIDIGGPTLIRAAAKNFENVVVIVKPDRYDEILEMLENRGDIDLDTRKKLAIEAFAHTARYDTIISNYLRDKISGEKFPKVLNLSFELVQKTRYGENPHQDGAFYRSAFHTKEPCIVNAVQLHGKELSYNNILDADCAIECIKEFYEKPTAVIIKHATPCGIASADNLLQAWKDAYATDIYSPFGGIVAFNRTLDKDVADEISKYFLEIVIAPSYTKNALEILKKKKNLRILELKGIDKKTPREGLEYRGVAGGLLIQDRDTKEIEPSKWKIVTKKKPSKKDIESMVFASKCVKHIKSNAVVFVKGTRTVAIGGGQTARVDATWIATHKGKENIKGSIMASDAFFPFRDAVDVAAEHGVKAIVQPGGSIRDQEVIDAANEHGIIMVFTGQRYFKH
jgi:phosphoribosylaminoimidazolecarboxamide formyltransferase/IMP cyclohydrolase